MQRARLRTLRTLLALIGKWALLALCVVVSQSARAQNGSVPANGVDAGAGLGNTVPDTGRGAASDDVLVAPLTDWALAGLEPAPAAFKDGFLLSSADGRHQLRLAGLLQADYRANLNPGDTRDLDTFLIRRARLGLEANLFDHFEFRFVPDWGNNRAVIQDAFINIRYREELQIQFGKFRPPIGYERLIRARFVATYERSLLDQLIPSRDVGFLVHGEKVLAGRVDYDLGVMNGALSGDTDSNDLRDFIGRLVFRPFAGEDYHEMLRSLQVGISASAGVQDEAMAPNPLRTPATIPWLTFAPGVRANGDRTRWTPEIAYFYRPLGLVTQYLRMDQEMDTPGRPSLNIPFDSFFVQATCLLTGETRTSYNEVVQPLRPFDPARPGLAPGAWELVVRFSRLRVSERIFEAGAGPLADPRFSSPTATELTLGLNWYLNALVRLQCNWEHAWYGRPITLGPDTAFSRTNAAVLRMQIMF